MRKPHVVVPQEEYLEVHKELNKWWLTLEEIALHFDVSQSAARRKLDGLVYQGRMQVEPGTAWTPRQYVLVEQ